MAESVTAAERREGVESRRHGGHNHGDSHGQGRGAVIRAAGRIWAVGAVHGEAQRLFDLHDALAERLETGDRIVYLGDFLGYGADISGTVEELLRFRAAFLARPAFVHLDDILCLRGQQEEIWQKLLQLQFAVNPVEVLEWALARGADATLRAYGGDPNVALASARGGPLALTRWTGDMREAMRRQSGHVALMSSLRRAAWTEGGDLLFVSAGIDPNRPLGAQTDGFWWGAAGFDAIRGRYAGFRAVVRGFDPERRGFATTPWTITVDGGCGFGGPLIAVCLSPGGDIVDRLER